MTDAHCHVSGGGSEVREFLIGRDFIGVHPWDAESVGGDWLSEQRQRLEANPTLGVGEIGLDRLRMRNISPRMHEVFELQLGLAVELRRSVVLHGAKCWGRVVDAIRRVDSARRIPSLLFHGFSRADGLIPDIVALNGYFSVGPAVLNDHAGNYRELVKKIPLDRLLFETDRTPESAAECPPIGDILVKTAELRGVPIDVLETRTDENAERFRGFVVL